MNTYYCPYCTMLQNTQFGLMKIEPQEPPLIEILPVQTRIRGIEIYECNSCKTIYTKEDTKDIYSIETLKANQ